MALCAPRAQADDAVRPAPADVPEVVITASFRDLIGKATTSSEGAVTKQELELRPVFRVGQLLETIPGLVVTVHSGEGKANQYLLRGFNLDHGTDLANFIDGMPANERTHAHGQGYTDLNFLIPELASGVRFTKGPYYAAEGDFAAVGSSRLALVNTLPALMTLSAGTVGDMRLFGGTTVVLPSDDRLILAAENVHLNGPWDHSDNLRKTNAALRYVHGDSEDGFSLTGLYYRGIWNATTDQPKRAMTAGLIGRFGTLDPSDGGSSERFSLSASYTASGWGPGHVSANAYVIRNQLLLINNFTHFLDDPVHGDQHSQNDRRVTAGGELRYGLKGAIAGFDTESEIGLQTRYDRIYVDARHTEQRRVLGTLFADRVDEANISGFVQTTVHVSDLVRAVAGLRYDHFTAKDRNLAGGASGDRKANLVQPKGSLIVSPWAHTELYLSGGVGFHSNDTRAGTLGDVGVLERPPFLVKAKGYEVGVRTSAIPHLQLAATVFHEEFSSELTYNADAGQTEAGRPGRRQGLEVIGQYRPFRWIELSANIAVSRARYIDGDPSGSYIEDAPAFVASAGVLLDNLGPWFGALEFRDLGAHALLPNNSIRSAGYREVNLNIGYKVNPKLKVNLDIFNLTDSKDNAADYFYTDRLRGEPASGIEDLHIHPLEPISARLAMAMLF